MRKRPNNSIPVSTTRKTQSTDSNQKHTMNIRTKKSNHKNSDGTANTIVRDDNVVREYSGGEKAMTKVRETIHPTNAAARRDMDNA